MRPTKKPTNRKLKTFSFIPLKKSDTAYNGSFQIKRLKIFKTPPRGINKSIKQGI